MLYSFPKDSFAILHIEYSYRIFPVYLQSITLTVQQALRMTLSSIDQLSSHKDQEKGGEGEEEKEEEEEEKRGRRVSGFEGFTFQ